MIKGDLRKKQILETAEILFSEKGYESTSVQDILDQLQLSKGSFYHHFESKEQILQKICESKVAAAAGNYSDEIGLNGIEYMNHVLYGMFPLHDEGLSILKVILPFFSLPEGIKIRADFQNELKKTWGPLVKKALTQMIQRGEAYTIHTEKTAEIVMDLMNDLWVAAANEIFRSETESGTAVSPSLLFSFVNPYCNAIENLISAPYASIHFVDPESLVQMTDEIHRWWQAGH